MPAAVGLAANATGGSARRAEAPHDKVWNDPVLRERAQHADLRCAEAAAALQCERDHVRLLLLGSPSRRHPGTETRRSLITSQHRDGPIIAK